MNLCTHKAGMYTSGEGVNFCIIREELVLLQQRDEHCPHYPLWWCIPGGAKVPRETYAAAAVREIQEEYALVVSDDDLVLIAHRPSNNPGQVFVVKAPLNATPTMREGRAMKWLPIGKLHEIKLGFNQSEFIVPDLHNWFSSQS